MRLRLEFVDYVPKQLDDGVLYVSIRFGTVVHRCACGCGEEVVTPLGPSEWTLTYDGRTVSLAPSIGNWSFPCRSHYWIDEGNVRWAGRLLGSRGRAGAARGQEATRQLLPEGERRADPETASGGRSARRMEEDLG